LKSNSKNPLSSDIRRKERDEKLKLVFENFPTAPKELMAKLEEVKSGLGKRLSAEEINNLCQVQDELTKSQTDLENLLQRQQAQIEIPPKK